MPKKYTEYKSYPGRQIEYTVVPRKFAHYFFEGVQSMDATHNSDEVTHGQFGFKSDVIIQKDYQNTSGTVSLKEFNNASYVLRGMTGVDPASSFVFDPSRLEHVDVFANILNKQRDRVLRSQWFADFTPSVSENESLDDIQTRDLSYTAIRKVDFEGYQIVVEEFLETKAGDRDFTLFWPATIDPTVQTSHYGTAGGPDASVVTGMERHDLCPIQFMLRVIVNGEVLSDPTQANVTTTISATGERTSVLHLATPIAEDGQPVIAMWLAEGTERTGQIGLTPAPVMIQAIPGIDTTAANPTWDGTLRVRLSEAVTEASVSGIVFESPIPNLQPGSYSLSNNSASCFVLTVADTGTGTVYELIPDAIGGTGAPVGGPAAFENDLITRNELVLHFENSAMTDSGVPTIDSTTMSNFEWTLTYRANLAGALQLRDEEGDVSPVNTIDVDPVA